MGNRQEGREHDQHVIHARPVAKEIEATIRRQLEHGRYPASTLYGDGHVSQRIADRLAKLTPYIQKRLHYIHDGLAIDEVAVQVAGIE